MDDWKRSITRALEAFEKIKEEERRVLDKLKSINTRECRSLLTERLKLLGRQAREKNEEVVALLGRHPGKPGPPNDNVYH